MHLSDHDILTRVTKYNLIRDQRMIYIDVHEALHGRLAGKYVAVPNLISLVAKQTYQGVADTEQQALADCLERIEGIAIEDLFPEK